MVRVCAPGGRVVVSDVFTSNPEQAQAFNRMEKLRDPSHVRALSFDELTGLFSASGLQNMRTQFYKHDIELEQILERSFPYSGDADQVRQMFVDDLALNRLGVGASREDGSIHYAYPVVVIVGQKLARLPKK
jgi:hypothetical protein